MVKKELPDFDVLLEMAKKRPEQLESLRLELIEDIISSASEDVQRRLRGLQFKVDVTRRTARTPMASCIKISQMMFDSLERLREALSNPEVAALQRQTQQTGVPVRVPDSVPVPDNVVSIFTYSARRSQAAKEARF
jgi:hypothetical protein